MLKRIVSQYQEAHFDNPENARKFAEHAEKSAKMRFQGFMQYLTNLNKNGNYLEVGSGSGILAAMIAEQFSEVHITALDSSTHMNTIASEYVRDKGFADRITIKSGNVDDEKFLQGLGKYDVIYSTYSMHHWATPGKIIQSLCSLLKEEGVLIIYDLKRVWWLYWIPKQSGFLNSVRASFTPREVREIMRDIGITTFEHKTIFPQFLQILAISKKDL